MTKSSKKKESKEEKAEDRNNNMNKVDASEAERVSISSEEYAQLKAQAEELMSSKEKLLRTMAEFENSKKRNEKQKEEFIQYANKKIILEFLPIMDNLTRAIESAQANHSVESMIEGVALINKQLQDILKSHGLEKIEAVGMPFDPHRHEAIGSVESDTFEEDIVADEVAPGYLYKEQLLRAAIVRVSSGSGVKDDDEVKTNQEEDV